MGSICLSSAPNLRCFPLSRNEFIAITVPTGVELLFSTYLIFVNESSGRKNLFLAAEGWFYFALALLEMLSHILPAARDNLNVFKIIDIFIGAASSVPLLLYTFFLLLFTSAETLDVVPLRFQRIGKALLVLFIPLIIASNAIASFVGITYRLALQNNRTVLAIGVTNEFIHRFFSSFALAFLTAFQAINFSFAFIRLAKAFVNSRRIEREASDEVVLFNGTGWITGGLKLGAIETVIGFASPGFGTSLVRRIFRLLARGCLIIGLIKGVDFSEDFHMLKNEIASRSKTRKGFRQSLRPFISNPRFSTFRQLSPRAMSFHQGTRSPVPDGSGRRRVVSGMDTFAAIKETIERQRTNQRVTVNFDAASGRAPTLEMRFSSLDMPSPALIVESIRSRPNSDWVTGASSRRASSSWYSPSAETSRYPFSPFDDGPPLPVLPALKRSATMPSKAPETPLMAHSQGLPSLSIRNAFANMSTTDLGHSRGLSDISSYSLRRSVVNEFPQIPQPPSKEELRKAIAGDPSSPSSGGGSGAFKSGTLSASSSIKRKPVPVYVPEPLDPFEDDDHDRERRSMDDTPLQSGVATEYTFGTGTPGSNGELSSLGSANINLTGLPRPHYHHRQMGSSSFTTPTEDSPFKNDFVEDVNSTSMPYTKVASLAPASAVSYNGSLGRDHLSGLTVIPPGGRIVSISPSEMLPMSMPTLSTVEEGSRSSSAMGSMEERSSPARNDRASGAIPESAVFPRDSGESSWYSQNRRRRSMESIDLSWLQNAGPKRGLPSGGGGSGGGVRDSFNTYEGEVQVQRATRTLTHQSKGSLTRIKSVGKAPRRYTPTPERTEFPTRGSVYVEPIVVPPRDRKMSEMEAVQGSVDSEVLGGPLRDSDVLGENVYTRRY
ncbi:hypothetical protein L218DRAFT_961390 [Marasmius fiardii PR-910]|nr:hypothetical protein L218DRAFT_961390 [Marasmius fiardii PR-910]